MNCPGYGLMQLVRWELEGTFAEGFDPKDLPPEALMELYPTALGHDLGHLAGDAIQRLGLLPPCRLADSFHTLVLRAHYRHERHAAALEELGRCLDSARIAYLPLKGCVLQALYPEPWMRTSSDLDLLLHRADLEPAAALLEGLGYERHHMDAHEVEFRAPDGVSVELHFELIEAGRVAAAQPVLARVWDRAQPETPGGCRYRMDAALFCVYHLAHMAKHLTTGGCGLRTFADLWLLERGGQLGTPEVSRQLERAGLTAFARAVCALNRAWFQGEAPDAAALRLMQYVLDGGAQGAKRAAQAAAQLRSGGRGAYLRARLFPSGETLQYQYPVLSKRPWLLPLCQAHRWGALLFGQKRGQAAAAFRTMRHVSEENIAELRLLWEQLGL